jgi:hypothetical protein
MKVRMFIPIRRIGVAQWQDEFKYHLDKIPPLERLS